MTAHIKNVQKRFYYEGRAILSIQEFGKKFVEAGRLKLRPLCVYGTNNIPQGAIPLHTIDRCIARAIFTAALFEETPPLYVDASHEQCCPGGMVWMGFNEPHPKLKYFVTVGTPDFQGGAAEHLKATPELFEEHRARAGKVTPLANTSLLGRATIISRRTGLDQSSSAGSEQIRNLCGLAQFNSPDPFFKTLLRPGATCSTMITFPAGMAENAPKDSAYVGPSDPTGNTWLPPELMVMGTPIALAQQMASDLDESFIGKRSGIAYPENRAVIKPNQ
jgi:hypothetical protein